MKNTIRVVITLLTLLLMTSFTTNALAEESKEYQSNAKVGFYGKYVYPDEEKDDDTIIAGDGEDNDETKSNKENSDEIKPDEEELNEEVALNGEGNSNTPTKTGNQWDEVSKAGISKDSLPQTGSNQSNSIGIIGLITVLISILSMINKKNRRKGYE